jgi:hypothetical protein
MPKRKGSNKKEILENEMPTLSIQEGKHHISYLNIVFNHSSSDTYNMEMYFKIEPSDENPCTTNSVSGEFNLKLHASFQGLISLIEPLIREEIGVADTTDVKINFIRIYPKHLEGPIFMMSMQCRATCFAVGCASVEHSKEIGYVPVAFVEVNKILESTGIRLNIDVEGIPASIVDDRFEILDL